MIVGPLRWPPAGGGSRCVSPDPKSGELPKYAGSKTGGNNEYVPLRTGVSSDGGAVGGARRAVDGRSESILVARLAPSWHPRVDSESSFYFRAALPALLLSIRASRNTSISPLALKSFRLRIACLLALSCTQPPQTQIA